MACSCSPTHNKICGIIVGLGNPSDPVIFADPSIEPFTHRFEPIFFCQPVCLVALEADGIGLESTPCHTRWSILPISKSTNALSVLYDDQDCHLRNQAELVSCFREVQRFSVCLHFALVEITFSKHYPK